MRLFNFRPARATARPALTRAFGSVQAPHGDWPQAYEAQVRAAYLGNAVAQRAVRIVAEGAGSVTVDATPDDHPAAVLVSGALVETIATHLLLHNEALARIDALLQPVVEAVSVNVPPASPVPGQCWIVGTTPSGEWNGQALAIAAYTDDGWRFVAPRAGMRAWSLADTVPAMFDGAGWTLGALHARKVIVDGVTVVGAQQSGVVNPSGGTAPDTEARAAISAILGALRAHGLIAS